MGQITTPKNVNNRNRTTENLMTSIIKGNAVLVLGHEGILNHDRNEGNVRKHILEKFFEYKRELNENFGSSYSTFDDYVYVGGADVQRLKEDISNMFYEYEYVFDEEEAYSKLIFELLKRRYFRLVLTTTYDHYVEHMMRKAWADEGDSEEDAAKKVRVLNIYGDNENRDLDPNELTYNDLKPTLYYIFGKAEEGKDFTVTENDAMKVTKKWMNEAEAPRVLLNYLKDKTILALGTKFDDWLFRFFWFSLHRDDKALRNGRVAISLSELSETERNLKRYLQKQRIENLGFDDTINFILNNYDNYEKSFLEQNAHGTDVFISYRSKSYDSVKHIFYAMHDNLNTRTMRTKIWFDRNDFDEQGLNPGADYTEKIQSTISDTHIFVPVICKHVVEALESDVPVEKFWFLDEWRQALERMATKNTLKPFTVIPICINGVKIENIHPHPSKEALFLLVKNETVATSKNPTEFTKFLNEIENTLKK